MPTAGTLAISVAPELGKWLFGTTADQATAAVAQAFQAITGASDEAVQYRILERDPEAATTLRAELARIAARMDADAQAEQRMQLRPEAASTGSTFRPTHRGAIRVLPTLWGAAICSVAVLLTFSTVMALTLTRRMPQGSETILNMLLGTLAAMATSIVNYWVGSSSGSARKDEHIQQMARSSSKLLEAQANAG